MPRWNRLNAPHPGARSHAGLWYDRAFRVGTQADDKAAKAKLVTDTAAIPVPALYHAFYAQWQEQLAGYGAVARTARINGRLVLGIGNASVIEAGITLHHTYGTPFVPGSALKGLCAHYAAAYMQPDWARGSSAHNTLFGQGGDKNADMGCVTFFDALYIPGSAPGNRPLAEDVVTIHHQSYYNKPGALLAPSDFDDPEIVPFLSVSGSYLVALKGDDVWVTAAWQILAHALVELGAGAKTAAGYGRMVLEGFESLWSGATLTNSAPVAEQGDAEWEASRILRRNFGALTTRPQVRQQLGQMLARWEEATDALLKRLMAEAIVNKVTQVGMQDDLGNNAAKYQAVVAWLAEGGQ